MMLKPVERFSREWCLENWGVWVEKVERSYQYNGEDDFMVLYLEGGTVKERKVYSSNAVGMLFAKLLVVAAQQDGKQIIRE